MNRLAIGWRRALGIAVAGATLLTASGCRRRDHTDRLVLGPELQWRDHAGSRRHLRQDASRRFAQRHRHDFAGRRQDRSCRRSFSPAATDGLPDIVLIEDDIAQKYLQAFPGSFEPLSDSIDMSKFAQYKVAAATYEGKSYSLPFDSGVAGLFYRSDYLAQAGYKADDLKDITWDDLIKIGKDVMAKTGHQMLDIDYSERGLIHMMLQSAGQWYFNEDGSLDILDNAALKASLEQYARIWQSGIVKPVSGWANFTGGFTSGEIAVRSGRRVDHRHDQGQRRPVGQVGRCADSEARRRSQCRARLQLGRLQLVRPGEIAEQGRRHRLPEVGLGVRR